MRQDGWATTIAWPITLAAAAVAGSLATACMMPFVAVATVAAATMRPGPAAIAVLGAWAANQILGFGLLGYPWTLYAGGWGAALAGASMIAFAVARSVFARAGSVPLRAVAGFGLAFLAFEGALFALALFAGGLATFTPAIVARLFLNDAVWLFGLTVLRLALTRTAPRWYGAAPAPQLA